MDINGFRGQLITADHADYDTARAVWNGTINRHPRLIARCRGAADVAAAVRFARDRDLEIAIRGGGPHEGRAPGDRKRTRLESPPISFYPLSSFSFKKKKKKKKNYNTTHTSKTTRYKLIQNS